MSEYVNPIKPGPKTKKEDNTDDQRRHVNPETKEKHPDLKDHKKK